MSRPLLIIKSRWPGETKVRSVVVGKGFPNTAIPNTGELTIFFSKDNKFSLRYDLFGGKGPYDIRNGTFLFTKNHLQLLNEMPDEAHLYLNGFCLFLKKRKQIGKFETLLNSYIVENVQFLSHKLSLNSPVPKPVL